MGFHARRPDVAGGGLDGGGVVSDLEVAAVRWLSLRGQCNALAKQRGAFECEREQASEWNKSEKPCWKRYEYDEYGRRMRDGEHEWCPPCEKRQAIHDELKPLAASRGAALRNLIRIFKLRDDEK